MILTLVARHCEKHGEGQKNQEYVLHFLLPSQSSYSALVRRAMCDRCDDIPKYCTVQVPLRFEKYTCTVCVVYPTCIVTLK